MEKRGLFVVVVAVFAAVLVAPAAWAADFPEPPTLDICAPIRAQIGELHKESVLPEQMSLFDFVFRLGIRRAATPLEREFEVTGWSHQDNVLVEVEASPTFILSLGLSRLFEGSRPPKLGVSGSLAFYEDSRSPVALFSPDDIRRERPYPIRQLRVGLDGSAFYTTAEAFERNVTRPLVCAVFQAVRQGRADRPVVVLAVTLVEFCRDLSGPEPQICGLNISGRVVSIFYRPEIPPPPSPSAPCPPGGCG